MKKCKHCGIELKRAGLAALENPYCKACLERLKAAAQAVGPSKMIWENGFVPWTPEKEHRR